MARKINALLDLAWATKSEAAIVGKLASQINDNGWTWDRWGGNKGEIRALVKSTRPHRGIGKKRLEAVVAAMREQKDVRCKRRRNPPIDWSRWERPHLNVRRTRVYKRLTGRDETCSRLSRINGNLVFLTYETWSQKLVIMRGGDVLVFRTKEACGTFHEAIMSWHQDTIRPVLNRGGRLSFDFAEHETILHVPHKNGTFVRRALKWPAPQLWRNGSIIR